MYTEQSGVAWGLDNLLTVKQVSSTMPVPAPSAPLPPSERERDATRSREAILEAAEQLFAERGYDATSLSDVGQAAGVSRGTPGYFFGSKADLYRAVLQHCFAEATSTIHRGRDRALASREAPEVILAGIVRDYFDFLADRPSYVKLMERNALGDGPPTGDELVRPIGQEALAAFMTELGLDRHRSKEAAHLLLSLLSLCWFPVVHARTYVSAVGLDPASRRFAEERRQHVIDLILHGVAGVLDGRTTGPRVRHVVRSQK
jgi:TetR/AcrR family transcriptional regulator